MGNASDIMEGERVKGNIKGDNKENKKKEKFVDAVLKGNVQQAKENYLKSFEVNTVARKMTLLHYASFKGYTDVVEFLLTCGADTAISDGYGNFPLHSACNKGQVKIVELLIKHGANVNILNTKNHSPLFFSVWGNQPEVTQILLRNGANANVRTPKKTPLLYIPCSHGNMQMVEVLVRNGALVNVPGSVGLIDSPLHIASNKGHYKIVSYLLKNGAHLSIKGETSSPLYTAVQNKRFEVIDILLDAGADVKFVDNQVNQTCLHLAATRNLAALIARFVSLGGDVNAADKNGLTPLHLAALHGNLEAAEVLVDHGANINALTDKGRSPVGLIDSPLHVASNKGHYKIVSYLLENGAHLSIKGETSSPLYTAVRNKRFEVIDILLDAGADVKFVDNQVNQTCLHLAATRNLAALIARFVSLGADVNTADKYGLTPLHLAAVHGNPEATQVLVDHGANVNALTNKGSSPLLIAKNDTVKKILSGCATEPTTSVIESSTSVTPTAPIMPVKDYAAMAEKSFEQQLEERQEELIFVSQRKEELEKEIENLNERITKRNEQLSDGPISQIQDHLECPICLEIPYSPLKIFQCEQGHIFCEKCHNKGLTHCPECRVKLDSKKLIRNRRLENVIKGLKITDLY